jgi:hypothetical protein
LSYSGDRNGGPDSLFRYTKAIVMRVFGSS